MSKQPTRYAVTAGTIEEALGALARIPGLLTQAFARWRRVRIVIEEAQDARSLSQNALQWKWCQEASRQGDQTAEEYQAWCKLHIGMAILCRDSDDYAEACQRVLGGLTYEQKLALMTHPFDWPVTRAMTKRQKTEYLDRVWQHFTSLGFRLTDPALKGINANDYKEAA